MSEYGHCKSCGKFDWLKYHNCPPTWEAVELNGKEPDWDDSTTVHASDAEEAAEKAAEEIDDSYAEGPSERKVAVRATGSEDWKVFEITFDYSVNYYGEEIDKDDME